MRGTLGKDARFRDYKYNAFVKSTPMVGPGSHKDQENFKSLKKKPCAAVMHPPHYECRSDIRARSEQSRSASRGSNKSSGRKNLDLKFKIDRRNSESKSPSKKGDLIHSGYLLTKSPSHKGKLDSRLNYELYKQDTFKHR